MSPAAGLSWAWTGWRCRCRRLTRLVPRPRSTLEQARLAWGCWADGVRQVAERHYRVADFNDHRVLSDPGYGRALDVGGLVGEAVRVAGVALRAAGGTAVCRCAVVKAQIGSPHP